MNVAETYIDGLKVIDPVVYGDDRGFFLETYHAEKYKTILGESVGFVQDNHSFSKKGTLRGMHFQKKNPQGKLVRVITGEVFDVALDLRKGSRTFGKWFGLKLSGENKLQLWVPPGFAHGFQVLSENAHFEYKCSDYYRPDDEACLLWNDPDADIKWPLNSPILSDKDKSGLSLKALISG